MAAQVFAKGKFSMSSKRRAATELTKDNWDDEEEAEQEAAGCFEVASNDDLSKRKIIKAKRRTTGENQGGGVFQGFKGFGALSSSTLPKPNIPLSGSSTCTSSLGSASTTVSEVSSKPPQLGFVSNTTTVKNSTETSTSTTNGSSEANPSYLEQIKALNQSVVTWIQSHVTSNPYIDLTPVFKDYENHMKDIDGKCCTAGSSSVALPSAATSSMFSTIKPSAATSSMFSTVKSSVASTSSMFSTVKSSVAASSMFSTVQSSVASSSMFGTTQPIVATSSMFGSAQSSTGRRNMLGTSSDETAAQSDAHVTSSASSSTQEAGNGHTATASNSAGSEQSKDEEDEEPCKPNKVAGPEKGAFYSVRCKLYFKRDSGWSELGVGMINLKDIDGKTQILMRNDTSLGKILLNVFLASNTPVSRSGKNNVMLVSVPNPPLYSKPNEEDNAKPATYLIRVKTGDDADKLHQELVSKKESSS